MCNSYLMILCTVVMPVASSYYVHLSERTLLSKSSDFEWYTSLSSIFHTDENWNVISFLRQNWIWEINFKLAWFPCFERNVKLVGFMNLVLRSIINVAYIIVMNFWRIIVANFRKFYRNWSSELGESKKCIKNNTVLVCLASLVKKNEEIREKRKGKIWAERRVEPVWD